MLKVLDRRDQVIAELKQQIAKLKQLNGELQSKLEEKLRRIAELEAKLAQNSTNSSKPPSSDPPSTDKKKPSKRRKSGKRNRGAQPGHKRHERKLVPESEVSKVAAVKPTHCRKCEKRLFGSDSRPYRHQVVEIPPIQPTVNEWRLHSLACEHCGTTTRAQLPLGVPEGNFGPRLQALVAVCSGVYRLSKRKTCELLRDVCGVEVSLGSISKLEQKTSDALSQPVQEVHQHAQNQPIVHADETSWKQRERKVWLWLLATTTVAVFLIRPSRSMKVAKELLGDFEGILVSDRYSGYGFVDAKKRQPCWAHLLRNIEAFRSWGLGARRLATQIQRPMLDILVLHHRVRDGTLSRAEFQNQAASLKLDILFHLRRGANWRIDKIAGVCRKILELKDGLFTFVEHEGVEPTNNHGERIIRHPVLWRKSSFGTDSDNGSRFVERILTTVMTLRLQNRNALKYVTQACTAALYGQQAPSLIPSE